MFKFLEISKELVWGFFIAPLLTCIPMIIFIKIFNIKNNLIIVLMALSIILISKLVYKFFLEESKISK
ncbi:MAG: heme/copper-type cytochrome/quinol oxidase subunit 4 [Rickettsiales bacterium]|jgi:heme/copper-type cytochrome/quinol oxidase subunit 4